MSSNPILDALGHFTLPQLLADPGLTRNVLNDIGASSSEIFLLLAALDARVPQRLLEHGRNDDFSVVEPRLIDDLCQRGVEQSRAAWAVSAWREAVGGGLSAAGSIDRGEAATVRPQEAATVRPGEAATVRPQEAATVRPGEAATVRPGESAAARPQDVADQATVRRTAPTQPPAEPDARRGAGPERRRPRAAIIAGIVVVLLIAGGIIAWLASSNGHPSSTGSKTPSQSSAATVSTPGSSTSVATTPPSTTPASTTPASTTPSVELSGPELALMAQLPKALKATNCVSNKNPEAGEQPAIICQAAADEVAVPGDLYVYGFSSVSPVRDGWEHSTGLRDFEVGACLAATDMRTTWRYNSAGTPVGDPTITGSGAAGGLFCFKGSSALRWIGWDYVPGPAIFIKASSATMTKQQLYQWWVKHASAR